MHLIKIAAQGQRAIPVSRFRHREKGLQNFVSQYFEEIFDAIFLKNEYWVTLDTQPTGKGSLDGRVDSVGITRNGTPILVEYKERKPKHMLIQSLYYDALMGLEPNRIERLVKDLQENDGRDDIPQISHEYRRKIMLISDSYHIFDLVGHTRVQNDIEVLLKQYKLFREDDTRYLYLYDAPKPGEVIQAIKALDGKTITHPRDTSIHNDGLFVEQNETLRKMDKIRFKDSGLDIEQVIKEAACEMFGPNGKYIEHNGIPLFVEGNGRVSAIAVEKSLGEGLEAIADARKLDLRSMCPNPVPDLDKYKPQIILIGENDVGREIEKQKDVNLRLLTFDTYQDTEDHYMIFRPMVTDDTFRTFPKGLSVYSIDSYTQHIVDKDVRTKVFPYLRKKLRSVGRRREVIEGFHNQSGITYSTPEGMFARIEPRNEFVSVKYILPKGKAKQEVPDEIRAECGYESFKDRYQIKTKGDIVKARKIAQYVLRLHREAHIEKLKDKENNNRKTTNNRKNAR